MHLQSDLLKAANSAAILKHGWIVVIIFPVIGSSHHLPPFYSDHILLMFNINFSQMVSDPDVAIWGPAAQILHEAALILELHVEELFLFFGFHEEQIM